MEIVLIRHAQPAWVADGLGVGNPGLTDLGHLQAAETAACLADDGDWDELLVSPLNRAGETAAPIAEATGLTPTSVDDLMEMIIPGLEGTPIDQVSAMFEAQRHQPVEEWWEGFPGGESFRSFHDRVSGAMLTILNDRGAMGRPEPHLWDMPVDPGRILIVAHGGTNALALGYLLGLEPVPWEWERFKLPHASISRIEATPLAGAHILTLTSFAEVTQLSEVTY